MIVSPPLVPPCPPRRNLFLEFVVTPAIVTPVEEIICASRRVITEAECEIAVTKLCLWPHDQPETSTLLHTYYFSTFSPLLSFLFLPSLFLPLLSLYIFTTSFFLITLFFIPS